MRPVRRQERTGEHCIVLARVAPRTPEPNPLFSLAKCRAPAPCLAWTAREAPRRCPPPWAPASTPPPNTPPAENSGRRAACLPPTPQPEAAPPAASRPPAPAGDERCASSVVRVGGLPIGSGRFFSLQRGRRMLVAVCMYHRPRERWGREICRFGEGVKPDLERVCYASRAEQRCSHVFLNTSSLIQQISSHPLREW